MNDTKASRTLGFLKILWPDLGTEKGIQDAIGGGAYASGYLAVSYSIAILLILFAGHDAVGPIDDTELGIGMVVVYLLLALASSVLTWFIWAKHSVVAAGIGLAWIGLEIVAKLFTMTGGRGMIVAVFALMFAIDSLRGTLAAAKSDILPPVEA